MRNPGFEKLLQGFLLALIGVGLTAVTYYFAPFIGGQYVVAYGAVIVGIVYIFWGFSETAQFMLSSKRERQLYGEYSIKKAFSSFFDARAYILDAMIFISRSTPSVSCRRVKAIQKAVYNFSGRELEDDDVLKAHSNWGWKSNDFLNELAEKFFTDEARKEIITACLQVVAAEPSDKLAAKRFRQLGVALGYRQGETKKLLRAVLQ